MLIRSPHVYTYTPDSGLLGRSSTFNLQTRGPEIRRRQHVQPCPWVSAASSAPCNCSRLGPPNFIGVTISHRVRSCRHGMESKDMAASTPRPLVVDRVPYTVNKSQNPTPRQMYASWENVHCLHWLHPENIGLGMPSSHSSDTNRSYNSE